MGRRGPQPKNPEARLRRNVQPLEVVEGEAIEAPAPAREWLKVTKDSWADYWDSDVSRVARSKDLPALVRLFHLRNEYERLRRMVHKTPLIKGSQGQPVMNPAHRMAKDYLAEIRQLEREFGLTPDAGVRIVKAAASAATSVEALTRAGDDDLQIIDVTGD